MDLIPTTPNDRPALLNLAEYYTYDFSDLLGLNVGEDGRFGGHHFDRHFEDPVCHPFLIRVEGTLAGFAVHEGRSRLNGEVGVNDVAEFFVLKRFRKLTIGERAAHALFDRFPGRWEVRQVASNVGATAFWRKAIERYTKGGYDEVLWNDDHFRGVVQRFQTSAAR